MWLNIKQAAEYCSCSESSFYTLRAERGIPSYKPFRELLFKQSDLDAYIESTRCTSKAETERQVGRDLLKKIS